MHRHGWTVLTRVRLRACWVRIRIPPMGSSFCPDISSSLQRWSGLVGVYAPIQHHHVTSLRPPRCCDIHSFTHPNPRPLPQLHQSHQSQEEESDIHHTCPGERREARKELEARPAAEGVFWNNFPLHPIPTLTRAVIAPLPHRYPISPANPEVQWPRAN